MRELPAEAGIVLANWNWGVVHRFVRERWSVSLSRSSCLNYLHRLGFAFKRPKKRLGKADERKRESFVADYAALWDGAHRSGARIFFVDEAHFRADAELRGKWGAAWRAGLGGLKQPALWREGQLLLGGVPGDRRGGVDGAGGEQQLRNIGRVPEAIEREARRAVERDLGQHSSITTTVQGGACGEARRAARRWAWERLARSLHSCVSSSHRSSSAGPNRSRGSISRTTR